MALLISLKILIPVILVIIILITILWILYVKNKKLFANLAKEKQKLDSYKQSIKNLQSSNQDAKQVLIKLNKLTRKFFKEYFNLPYNLAYLELSKQFNKKPGYAKYCESMSDINYQGNKLTKKQIKELINQFSKIVESY